MKNKRKPYILITAIAAVILTVLLAVLLSQCRNDRTDAPSEESAGLFTLPFGQTTDAGDETPTPASSSDAPTPVETPAHRHSFGDWTTLSLPDCTAPGARTRTCAECGFEDRDDVSPLGHDGHDNVCVRCGKKAEEPERFDYSSYPYGEGIWITSASGFTDADVLIPDVINGEPVVCIAANAFQGSETVVSLSLPDSVTQLGSFIFYKCPSIRMIRFGKNYGNQYTVVAGYCPNLDYLTVDPENKLLHSDRNCVIETATKTLIMGCSGSIIPDDGSVTTIDGYAFQCCSGLTSITVPASVTTIEQSAFTSCFDLISLDISDSVTTIEQKAFSSCVSLKEVRLPSHLKEIGVETFYNCVSLEEITIPSEVTLLDADCFYGCTSLKNVRLPEGLKKIGNGAFKNCTSLESITLPSGLTSLGSAFSGCTSLGGIAIPEGVERLYSGTFFECSSLKEVQLPEKLESIPANLFGGCTALTEVTVPDGVTSIDRVAFRDCAELAVVTLPASLKYVGEDVFEGCTALETVVFKGTEARWKAIGWDESDDCLKNASVRTEG